jgi:polysaccharide biosynthesis/export protein
VNVAGRRAAPSRGLRSVVLTGLLAVAGLALGACGGSGGFPYAKLPDPRRAEYVIGPADLLAIRVWHDPDLASDLAVRPDGTITMPLIGDLVAAGLTPTQLKEQIKARLATFMREDPTVTVAVTNANSYYVVVSGNITTPGRFESKSYLTVSEAIALGGGPNRFASPSDCFVLRRGTDHVATKIPVDYTEIVKGLAPEQDVVLLRGDLVVVP